MHAPSYCLLALGCLLLLVTGLVASPLPSKTGGSHERSTSAQDDDSKGDMVAEASSITEVELSTGEEDESAEEEEAEGEGDARGQPQHFFPSFTPLFSSGALAHSRHNYDDQPRGFTDNYRSVYPSEDSERVLGSGNFGVLRGGTYYGGAQDEEEEVEPPYYRGNNGHGRPPYFRGNPQPAYRHGGDFFAGFRDFADITTPPKSAYSEYYVVYANKNGTERHPSGGPKNIMEQLALLDAVPEKLSKNKQKLAEHKEKVGSVESKKKKSKSPKDMHEPLLALS